MTSSKDAHLYGIPRPRSRPISTATPASLSFAANLGALIAQPSKPTSSARSRPPKSQKDDIFTAHNRNVKKRSAADLAAQDDVDPKRFSEQRHNSEIGGVDTDTLHRSKRKMEEKARLYAAMKRGDYVPPTSRSAVARSMIEERAPLVDFDRKWADAEAAGEAPNYDTSSDDGGDSSEGEELIEYTDEFGRTRKATRAQIAREHRNQRIGAIASEELESISARPARPEGIIRGDTIQAAAFNPEENVAAAMAELAAKRDRSITPPPDTHYDATKEVRSKGVGFYQFSQDKEGREKEFRALEKERRETERREEERKQRREKKAKDLEERRRKIGEKKAMRQADMFLKGLERTFVPEEDGKRNDAEGSV